MTAQPLQITPPESFTSSPPTPPVTEEKIVPPISRILAVVKQYRAGNRIPTGEHWLKVSLDGYQYEELQRQLRKNNLWDHYKQKFW